MLLQSVALKMQLKGVSCQAISRCRREAANRRGHCI